MTASKKRALANQYEEYRLLRFSKFGRSMVLLFASLLSFALISLLITDQLLRPDAFVIKQLKIKGKFAHTQPQRVEAVIREHDIGNFFSVELEQIKRQVEQVNWVRSADVRREWPDTLLVQVDEHRPAMRWGKSQWLNSYGEIIDVNDIEVTQETVTLHGEPQDSELIFRQALKWRAQLAKHNIELKNIHLSGSHAWRLKLKVASRAGTSEEIAGNIIEEPFELLIGREDVESRFQRFLIMYKKQFAQQPIQLTRVDARYPNGLATITSPLKLEPNKLLSKI